LFVVVTNSGLAQHAGVEAIQAKHDRALIQELTQYLVAHPRADDADSGYQILFNKVIEHDWFTEFESAAKQYLTDYPEGGVRSLARIITTMARAQAGSHEEALASFNTLLAGLSSSEQVEFAAEFAENLANAASSAGEFDVARKVYASLLKKFGDDSPQVKQKVGEALARLDRIGKDAPASQVNDLDGKPFKFAELKGKYVLVDFWATWCAPCVAELPRLATAYEKYKGKGLEIVAISLDETKPAVVDFVKAKGIPWRQIHNATSSGDLVAEFGVSAIPATFLIDPTGKIVRLELRGETLDKALKNMLR
jgi:thiol-disulfide isomerase/thioredoxin